jgi:WD40 repeat protein
MKNSGAPHVHLRSLAVSLKGNTFFYSGADGRIFEGDYLDLKNSPTGYITPYPSKVIALSKDEKYLVNGSDSSVVQVYELSNRNNKPLVVKGFKGASNDIEFLPNNSGFILASSDKGISLVNHLTGTLKRLLTLPYEIKSISISPDGNSMAGATWSGQVVVINLNDNSFSLLYDDPYTRVLSVKYNSKGDALAYGTDDIVNKKGFVRLYNFKNKETRQFTGHRAGVYDVEFSTDDKLLASAGSDKRLQMWVLENPEDLPVVMDNNNGFVWDIAFTKDSDYLIAACSESEIRVWPTDPVLLAQLVCPKLYRNMTQEEWKTYVGEKIDFETTCVVGGLIKDY